MFYFIILLPQNIVFFTITIFFIFLYLILQCLLLLFVWHTLRKCATQKRIHSDDFLFLNSHFNSTVCCCFKVGWHILQTPNIMIIKKTWFNTLTMQYSCESFTFFIKIRNEMCVCEFHLLLLYFLYLWHCGCGVCVCVVYYMRVLWQNERYINGKTVKWGQDAKINEILFGLRVVFLDSSKNAFKINYSEILPLNEINYFWWQVNNAGTHTHNPHTNNTQSTKQKCMSDGLWTKRNFGGALNALNVIRV